MKNKVAQYHGVFRRCPHYCRKDGIDRKDSKQRLERNGSLKKKKSSGKSLQTETLAKALRQEYIWEL